MKRIFLLCAACACLFMACSKQDIRQQVAVGDPIMPVMCGEDNTTIVLTDYVPRLELDSQIVLPPSDAVRVLTIQGIDIPVLPALPRKQALYVESIDKNIIRVAGLHEDVHWHVFWQNKCVFEGERVGELPFPNESKHAKGRSFIRIYATDGKVLYNDLLIPLQDGKPVTDADQLTRHDHNAQVLYSLMVDRFANGDKNNDWKLNSPEVLDAVDYQGGDFAGITQKIEEGFFDDLGINTIWVSPITQNPWDAWGMYVFKNGNKYDSSKPYTKFSGYHGYWPIYATRTDIRFGSEDEFRALLDAAHKHGINVILDYVANHMHINSPTYKQHPDWHTDSILPDGRRNFELWDEERLTTWFDRHIPTLDLEREDICEAMTDSALFWLENFELDGFRHDACKHIPEDYWRLLGRKIATRFPGRPVWMIGETYGSPALISSYVKTGQLNAQFDFNIYFAIRDALVQGKSFVTINNTVLESLAAYGAHHTMGNISGNHDQIRFASLAGEAIGCETNGKEEGWTGDVNIGDAQKAYTRALQQEALNLTLPGVPCIYQGDEYAEYGANDPDNRHNMRFDDLSEDEQAFRNEVKKLIALRRSNMALMYGEYIPVEVLPDTLIFDRIYLGNRVRVTVIRDKKPIVEVI